MEASRLVLDNTYSGDAGLSSALQCRSSSDLSKLEFISLSGCNITSVGLRQITSLLNGLEIPDLHYLNLEWNPIINEDDSSIRRFFDAVSKSSIRHLSLRECSLNHSAAASIVDLIRNSVSLQKLELGHNNLGQLDALLDAVDMDNHTITELDLSGNGLTATQSRRLRALLERNASFSHHCGATNHTPPDDYPTIPHTPTPRNDRACVACAAAAELSRFKNAAAAKLADATDAADKVVADLRKKLVDLTDDFKRTKKQLTEVSAALDRKDFESSENEDRINKDAKRALDSVSAERDRFRDESITVTRQLFDLNKTHAKLVSDLDSTSTRLEGKCSELDSLKARIQDEGQHAQEEISRLKSERNALRAELDSLTRNSLAADGAASQEKQSMRSDLHKAREAQLSAAKVETELRAQISALVAELTTLTDAEAKARAAAVVAVEAEEKARATADAAIAASAAAQSAAKREVESAIKKTRESVEAEFRARETASVELKLKIAKMAREVLEAVN